MRKARKEELLYSFPAIPEEIADQMNGRHAANYAVMLTKGQELFVRCYHRYSNGEIEERQRYVFADDGSVRYGSDDGERWTIRKEFREPVFCKSCYGYTFNNSYTILNFGALTESCMKYSQLEHYHGNLVMEYLHLYCKHHNLEYLMKSGYGILLGETYDGFWGSQKHLSMNCHINWKSNNLLKMLHLNKAEFKALQGHEEEYFSLIGQRDRFPGIPPEELLEYLRYFKNHYGTIDFLTRTTGLNLRQLYRYFVGQNIGTNDYADYLIDCQKLKYCLTDKEINRPKHFQDMHIRTALAVKYQHNESVLNEFAEHIPERRKLEFQSGNLTICQPDSIDKIIAEGKALHHCVGGYAERHATGKLHILFIRQTDQPEMPFYTMEVSTTGKIIQVRGCRNCEPTPEVSQLIESYQHYLGEIFTKKERKAS